MSRGKAFIRAVINNGNLDYGSQYYERKRTRSFSLNDIQSFGAKEKFAFLSVYYNAAVTIYRSSLKYDWLRGKREIKASSWVEKLGSRKIEIVFLSKKDIKLMLFPLTLDEDFYDDVRRFIKDYNKLISSMNGLVSRKIKDAQAQVDKAEALKQKLLDGNSWSWSRDKKDEW